MNSRGRVLVWFLLCVTALFALGTLALQWKATRPPPLLSFKAVPDFQLTERSGQPITLADLKSKVWLADFVYSTCPGPCPMISSRLAELQKKVLQRPDVRLVSITTNPTEDTPEVLKKYAERFNATDRWLFLTGDKPKVYDLIQHGFSLAVAEQADVENPVVHSTKIALVDKKGVIRKYYDGQNGGESDDVILRDIDRLLRE